MLFSREQAPTPASLARCDRNPLKTESELKAKTKTGTRNSKIAAWRSTSSDRMGAGRGVEKNVEKRGSKPRCY